MKTTTGISDLEYPDGRMAHTDVEKAESAFKHVFLRRVHKRRLGHNTYVRAESIQRATLTRIHYHQRRHGRSSFGSTETKQVPWRRRTSSSSTGRTKERDGNTIEDDFHTFIT